MVSDVLRLCALACVAVAACLPDNPNGELTTESESSDGSDSETGDGSVGLLGCAAGETCTLVLVSETLDDRVEIFEPGGDPAYRGSISVDLKPGSDSNMGTLDEPFGLALVDEDLHVIAGHYPQRESGSMLSFSGQWLSMYEAGTEVPVGDYFTGTFIPEVEYTPFEQLEPIFMLENPVGSGENTRLLVSVFNNNLFTGETMWDQVGRLAVVDAADPSNFGIRDLSFGEGEDAAECLGASQLVLLEGGTQAAVACDGNEAIAFLDLGSIATGEPDAAAAAITGSVCEIPGQRNGKRVRYLAPAGAGGVLVQYGPGFEPSDGQIMGVAPDCAFEGPATVGQAGRAWLGELVAFGNGHWLVASGGNYPMTERGIYVIDSSVTVCGSIGGFDWDPAGGEGSQQLSPYGLAVAPDGAHLAVGAAPFGTDQDDGMLGKVLWATLSGTDDPCTMMADVVDLTDGAAGHAPASNPNDARTWRRGPNVVVIEEVQG